MVTIRAKSELKLQTPNVNMTYTYPKGLSAEAPVGHVIELMARVQGKEKTIACLKGLITEVETCDGAAE